MELLLEISYSILMVGGALCMLLLLFILFYTLNIMMKTQRLVKNAEQTYQQAMMVTTLPLRKIMDWLGYDEEEEDEDW